MVPKKLLKVLPDIERHINDLPMRVFTASEFQQIISDRREIWQLPKSLSAKKLVDYLSEESQLKVAFFDFPNRKEIRLVWSDVPMLEVVSSLKEKTYFTHFTAMHLHQLTEQIPKTIYLNQEQAQKIRRHDYLTQDRIDYAFKKDTRFSRNIAVYQNVRICLLSGMYTGQLGVIDFRGPDGEKLRVTNVERTLIDITVRPNYSGGVHEVLKAYRLAADRFSVNRLVSLLKKLNYVYPYHQAIGFYLERTGLYKSSAIDLLRKLEKRFDFYLTHNMKEMDYSPSWKLHFPKGF